MAIYRVMRALEELGLGRRTGDGYFEATVPLAEVAAWLADEMEAAHDLPYVPHPLAEVGGEAARAQRATQ